MGKRLKHHVIGNSCIASILCGLALNVGNLSVAAIATDRIPYTLAQAVSPVPIDRPLLKIGSQGAAVSELQAALKLLGYYTGSVDGFYQQSTAIAVSQFQQAAGLNPDGIAGPATWIRLFPTPPSARTSPSPTSSDSPASSFPVPTIATSDRNNPMPTASNSSTAANLQPTSVALPILKSGMRGPAVAQLQARLKALGFLNGSSDGVFGAATQAAVKAAQQRFNLTPDGIVGSATWSALLR
ncbi:MAG TPA: peptidoglycan-binding domain-containing protein [Allocoleopsis sp.]